ncbi:hypothetical protein KAFR_0I02650 [Kazachstania africana CBS 2517]|uniref:Uncharacterized protein n=1 Tax=Kazachstania africana (strain ATCC 22294 / BCRC 22015 / CBS 2517 / CECT 1963 / NBRC 1671 / NRRL Y-8276) TaxID=1071382 RepID=H2B094_KAZAF|nr:hypothetical protein KAFR_0I02650 [Kazachstania africana CBS 2517]CCF60044.1 hypothetical protein KAFR_0I02650 [Kazachstania africana CBS 2517]
MAINKVVNSKKVKKDDLKIKKPNLPLKKSKKPIKVLSKSINYSLCIPTSILNSCSNLDQITHTLYQIAKAATLFNVAEIVILDQGSRNSESKITDSMLMASLLQYFVTPPYLIKSVFKKQYLGYFKIASKLPRILNLPFMRYLEANEGRYREGLSIRMTHPDAKKEFKQTKYINIGKAETLELKSQLVPTNVRVTVDIVEKKVVSPIEAYGDFVGANSSYGYHVRIAKSFGDIFTESAFSKGYSQAIWINSGDYYYNENLKKYHKVETKVSQIEKIIRSDSNEEPANVLLVCGKWDHIKTSFNKCKDQFDGCDGAHQFFDGQIELPGAAPQGNINIEDSCMIALTALHSYL